MPVSACAFPSRLTQMSVHRELYQRKEHPRLPWKSIHSKRASRFQRLQQCIMWAKEIYVHGIPASKPVRLSVDKKSRYIPKFQEKEVHQIPKVVLPPVFQSNTKYAREIRWKASQTSLEFHFRNYRRKIRKPKVVWKQGKLSAFSKPFRFYAF